MPVQDFFIKVVLVLLSLGAGFTVPVLTYEYRIASLEVFQIKTESDRFRRSDAELLLKDLELQLRDLKSAINSNRTFIARECHRNNIQDEILGQRAINNCTQDF